MASKDVKACIEAIKQNNVALFKKSLSSDVIKYKDEQEQNILHIACSEGLSSNYRHSLLFRTT